MWEGLSCVCVGSGIMRLLHALVSEVSGGQGEGSVGVDGHVWGYGGQGGGGARLVALHPQLGVAGSWQIVAWTHGYHRHGYGGCDMAGTTFTFYIICLDLLRNYKM